MAASATDPTAIGRACDRLAVAVLLATAAVAALTFRDYGLSWDDYAHAEYGDLLLAFYVSGFEDWRAFSFVNLYRYGGGFDLAAALLAKVSPFDLFETRRLLGAAIGLAGLAATWRVGRRLGGPVAGFVALALLAACPPYIGHMYMNPKDAPFAAAMALLLLGLVRVLEGYPRPTAAARAVFAVGLGLAVGSRILAGLDALAAAAALLLVLAHDARSSGLRAAAGRLGSFLLTLVPAAVAAYAVMAVVWPWGVIAPLNPLRAIGYFSHFFEVPWRELFAGRLILVPDMPAGYLPTLLALKLPEVMLALGLGGLVGALVAAARPGLAINRRGILLLVALAAALPVAIVVATRPAMYNGIRHFLFVLPPFAALGGLAGGWFWTWLALRGRAAVSIGAAALVIGLALPVVEMTRLHPYAYTYFNHASGGVRAADGRYMLDYWGLSFKQAAGALQDRIATDGLMPPAGGWRIAVCGPHRPVQAAFGPGKVATTWDPVEAQFAITLGTFYCRRLAAPLISEVVRDGVVYARVYDLRGVSLPTLLSVPGLPELPPPE